MPKKQQQLVILGVLVMVMITVYARALLRPAASARAPAVRAPADVSAPAAPRPAAAPEGEISLDLPADTGLRQTQRARATGLAWGRDPFTGGSAGGEVSGFDLSGILWDASQPIAIINGQMLRVGDEVEGYRILEITRDRVTMSDGSEPLNLLIPQ